ncbi:Ribokinase-like protein, partial [Caulochytrium protostelioides]
MSTDAVAQAAAEATRPTEVTEGALFGIENPLLDISARVKPELLAKYKLKANDAILAGDEHATLYDELLADYPVEYIAGGAAQNSMRGATWLLPPKSTVYVGCVGQDAQADQLKATAVRDGLRTEYMVDPTTPTGKCAVLITNNDRSMVTALGAANNYNEAHIQQPEIWKLVEQAKVYYIGGFFMTVSPATIGLIARHAVDHGKQLAINLSAPFITQF